MKLLVTCLAFCVLAGTAHAEDPTPIDTTELFYRWAVAAGVQPDAGVAQSMLSRRLHALLSAQTEHERRCIALAPPDEKPHMLDQSPFFLWPDVVSRFDVLDSDVDGATARVRVRLAYEDLDWIDVARLIREEDRWAIDELEWERGSLSERLTDFLSIPCTSAQESSR